VSDVIYVPFPRELYDNIIRFSDGRLDPIELAVDQLEQFVDRNAFEERLWGDRWEEVAKAYATGQYEAWLKENESRAKLRPLIWKSLTVPHGTEVRMNYYGKDHFARVENGAVVDEAGSFSPAEWCRKVANGTQRNAWRDLWLRFPGERDFVQALNAKGGPAMTAEELLGDLLKLAGDRK
jgi:hypothetical protein